MTRVAILGTGLIGTSIALALRERGNADVELIGYDRYMDVARKAERLGAFHRVAPTAPDAVRSADLVILAVPPLAIQKVMEEVASALGPETIVTDTGSTKAEVLRWAASTLAHPENFVGGHPMAGKTEFGPSAA
jgi:prephenate dehydrogenase